MKQEIVAMIERVVEGKLTSQMVEQIANEAISIIDFKNKEAALAAIETVKQRIVSDNGEKKS